MDLIFPNLFLCQRKFLRIQMPVILSFFNARDLHSRCAAHTQTYGDVTCSRSCDQGKITKKYWKI